METFDVEEIRMRLFVEQEKRWARSWPSALRKLEREFPPGFVVYEVKACLQEGVMPEYPQILDICQRIRYCQRLQAEAEAKAKPKLAPKSGKAARRAWAGQATP